jgi:hypothetical protein
VTTADTPYRRASGASRAWRWFRRWRRGRPFWGGLFTIIAAIEYYLSGHLDLLPVTVHIGPQGFLSYVIPLVLLLCGILLWATPGQRIFYGIIAAVTAIYGLIGLNLGGFGVGMVLGMVGGALGASWAPVQLPPAARQTPPVRPPTGRPTGVPARTAGKTGRTPPSTRSWVAAR